MVNGWTSRITYVAALMVLVIAAAGYVVLAALDKDPPNEMIIMAGGAAAFLFGTHVQAPQAITAHMPNDPVKSVVEALVHKDAK